MKLYVVFGIEYHVSRELLGIYDSFELADERQSDAMENPHEYNDVVIDEIELNKSIYNV